MTSSNTYALSFYAPYQLLRRSTLFLSGMIIGMKQLTLACRVEDSPSCARSFSNKVTYPLGRTFDELYES